ncbi:MAG TPA: sugar ABC transporter permease [Geminicoccus sp.]|jgi:multiple sugar transport system permease protein|uniref:carbohydrate ABC transporter permease n=1 Tax=Geminicoccus sp. TaxID=2024832 RepID=UPI002E31AD35|nr:sugar ABC transporter permease [Geminicoccus sp.]HEX2528941.1 sugar ABC transporter permease [Geminicoccus sp.]
MAVTTAPHPVPARTKSRLAPALLPYLLSLPALLVCIGIIIPFFTAVWYSLQRYNMNLPSLRGFVWFQQYVDLFTNRGFWHTVSVSLTYTVATVVLELLLGLGIALLLRRPTKLHNIMSIALLLPLMVAPAIAALMWKLMTHPDFGILSWLIQQIGITDFRWASAPSTALFTVLLVDIWVYTPFMMILLLAGLRGLPKQPFEAAALDGVPASFVFFRITLPMLTPYMITAALFRMLDSIQQFDIIYAMTQGGPGDTLMVFQVMAYLEFFQNFNVGRSAAVLMVLWAIAYLLSNIFIKHWLRLRERARGAA